MTIKNHSDREKKIDIYVCKSVQIVPKTTDCLRGTCVTEQSEVGVEARQEEREAPEAGASQHAGCSENLEIGSSFILISSLSSYHRISKALLQ